MSVKQINKKAMDDPELQDLFNQMVGASDPDPSIVAPKYEAILSDCKAIVSIFDATFANTDAIPGTIKNEFNKAFSEIKQFVTDAFEEFQTLTLAKNNGIVAGAQVLDINKDPKQLEKKLLSLDYGYDAKELGEVYKKLKESTALDKIIVAVRDLRTVVEEDKKYHKKTVHDIEDKTKLSDGFISKYDSDSLQLVPSISKLDFKMMWMHEDIDYNLKKRIVFALHLILKRGTNIVQNIMSPDIDVEKFSSILVDNIDKVRKHVPRCDKAFNKIKQSVQMLKNNFSGYYKDFVISKNPGIIVENFVLDVAEGSKADPETTRQFRRIVQFYQEKMRGQVKDPKIQKIFDLVGENLNILERKTGVTYDKKDKKDQSDQNEKSNE